MNSPSWDTLHETASSQEGYFTLRQAQEAHCSAQLLQKYLKNGQIHRAGRGIYRFVRFPPGEHEDLVVLWLWSEREGVFSHETALALHQLSDVLPSKSHITLPPSWRARKLRVPENVQSYYAELEKRDRTWVGPIPVTTPARTINDCATAQAEPILVHQAIEQGIRRSLFPITHVAPAVMWLASL